MLLKHNLARGVVAFDGVTRIGVVWVWNPETGRVIGRRTESDEPEDDSESQAALRIAELLRAVFVELDTVRPPSDSPSIDAASVRTEGSIAPDSDNQAEPSRSAGPGPETARQPIGAHGKVGRKTAVPAGTRSPPQEKSRRTDDRSETRERLRRHGAGFELEGAVSALSFDYPPAPHAVVGGYWQRRRLIGPELMMFVPLFPLRIEQAAGTVDLRKGILFVGARLSFRFVDQKIGLDLGAGAGLDITFIRSDPTGDFGSEDTTTFAGLPYGRLGGDVILAGPVALTIGILIGTDIPRTRVSILDESVITTAPLFLVGTAGVRVVI